METKDILTIIGWPMTLVVGIASGFIVSRFTRKKQILTWAIVNEADIIPREWSDTLGIPVVLQVGDARPSSLSILTIRIGNSGNEVIKDASMVIRLNPGASILNIRLPSEAGEYADHIKWTKEQSKCRITAEFINQNQSFEIDILASEYESGAVDFDAPIAGVQVRRTSAAGFELLSRALSIKGVKLNIPFMGIGYDPGSVALSEVAEEIKAVRRILTKQH